MTETEAILLERFTVSGDAQAFAEIIRRHAGLVYGAALRILADVDQASDVAQETFLQLTKDAGRVTGSLPGWLHRVATHKAIDRMRRDASRKHREKEYAARRPDETGQWKKISPYVDVGLRELDPELRDVLILHFLEGRTTREIASLQGASQATISRRIGSGVEQLRTRLRRRGILVAVGALSALLGDNAVQAAPLPLLTELGKMAMVGGAVAGTAGAGAGLSTIAAGVLTAVKTKAVAVAALAVIGAGSVVTCYEMTKSSSEPAATAPVEFAAASPERGTAGSPMSVQSRPGLPSNGPEAETQWDQPTAAAQNPANTPPGGAPVVQPPIMDPPDGETESVPTEMGGHGAMMGGMGGMAIAGSPEPPEDNPGGQAATGGGLYAMNSRGSARSAAPVPDSNDPNDPNDPHDPNERGP